MTRRLVVCCDGTWNRPDEVVDGVPAPTNVSKLALGVARVDDDGVAQPLFYEPGVGTRRFERLRGGAFGLGLGRNVRDCYRFLVETYRPGDELYFFGFSRGAFTARSTVGLVRNSGILRREHAARIDDAYRLYRSRAPTTHPEGLEAQIFRRMHCHEACDVHFVGVWDTVGALGIPIDGLRLPFAQRLWGFHDTTLSRHVRFAYQALAIDEQRGPFRPTLWQRQADADDQTLEQVWFAGVHSDVGGGYPNPALAEIALLWMVQRARECGLAFDADHFTRPSAPVPARRRQGADTAPDALGVIHSSRKGLYDLMPRHVRRLDDSDGSALSLASSAVRRRSERSDYAPANLDAYARAQGPVTQVEDRPAPS